MAGNSQATTIIMPHNYRTAIKGPGISSFHVLTYIILLYGYFTATMTQMLPFVLSKENAKAQRLDDLRKAAQSQGAVKIPTQAPDCTALRRGRAARGWLPVGASVDSRACVTSSRPPTSTHSLQKWAPPFV